MISCCYEKERKIRLKRNKKEVMLITFFLGHKCIVYVYVCLGGLRRSDVRSGENYIYYGMISDLP